MPRLPFDEFVDNARRHKAHFNWLDLQPILHVLRTDNTTDLALLVGGGMSAEAILVSVTTAATNQSAAPIGSIGLIVDLYVPTLEDGTVDMTAQTKPGSLERRWQTHDREGISEALVTVVAHSDGTVECAILPYDAPTRTWGPMTLTGEFPPFTTALAGRAVELCR